MSETISAATYTWDNQPYAAGYLLAEAWSLSLEEQFYLLWPPCLVLLGKRRNVYSASFNRPKVTYSAMFPTFRTQGIGETEVESCYNGISAEGKRLFEFQLAGGKRRGEFHL
jgi:hypothetical protein